MASEEQDQEGGAFIDPSDVLAEEEDDSDIPMDGDDHGSDDEDIIYEIDEDSPEEEEPEGTWEDTSIAHFSGHKGSVFAVAVHPTQPLVVSGGEDDLGYIWDLKTGEDIVKLSGHTDSVTAVDWSYDGELVSTGGMDGKVRVWRHVKKNNLEWKVWEFLTELTGPDEVMVVPSGNTMQVLASHTGPVNTGCFTPDGKRILTGSQVLLLTTPSSETPILKLTPADGRFSLETGITALAINSSNALAIVGGAEGGVRVVSLVKGDVVGSLEGHTEGESIEAVAWMSYAGAEVALTGGTDGKICLWDLGAMRLRITMEHADSITSLHPHQAPSTHLLTSSSSDKTLRTWDVRTGTVVKEHKGHHGPVLAASLGSVQNVVSLLTVATSLLSFVDASNVLDLKPSTFDEVIGKGKPALVELLLLPVFRRISDPLYQFRTLVNLAPIYEQLADAYSHSPDVIIAKVDADAEKDLACVTSLSRINDDIRTDMNAQRSVRSLKWFLKDGTPEDYSGGRELQDLADFVTKKSGVKSKIKPPPPSAVTQLNYLTLEETINDPTKSVLVAYTASWCGHCKALKPTYEKVATDFKSEPDVIIANYECDAEPNKPLAEKMGIGSFPTLRFYPKGIDKNPVAYDKGRGEQDFIDFINKETGTFRTIGGGLNDAAGRATKLDEYARQFFNAVPTGRRSIYETVKSLEEATIGHGIQYIRTMEKILNGTTDYVEKELKRLGGLLEKQTLSDGKLDQIKVKANILYAFTEKEKVSDESETKGALVKDEL
ncbi:hypothetical protein Clacol_002849 [Clathrus columnatus]|uniref:Thioredoxin domain-containing protein n=1 Tax=Clathrus columnatus TaxID=1419009 RepID=A0AAV5A6P2_9AGAM|nr:hypothetical protein Clacol_002849 [Clathrus columnatus]